MTKTFNYKSSFIKFEDDKKGIKATILSPQGKKETETFTSKENAKYWLISKAEYYDRQAYDYMY